LLSAIPSGIRASNGTMGTMAARAQKPLELILARNLLTSLSTPAFLVDEKAELVFYNEAAGALLGRPFEDVGRMSPQEWIATYGPFGEDGEPMALDDLPTTRAIRDGRPAHASFRIRSAGGTDHEIASSAFPIVASEEGSSGAMILFWPTDEKAKST
jgi:PAS domain-containing protein